MYFNLATCQMGQMTLYAIKCLNIFQPITRIIIINPIMELLSITYTLPDYIKIHFINQKKKHHLPDPLVFVGGLANLTTPNTLTVVLACNSLSFRYLYSVVFVLFSVIASGFLLLPSKMAPKFVSVCISIPSGFFFFNVIC